MMEVGSRKHPKIITIRHMTVKIIQGLTWSPTIVSWTKSIPPKPLYVVLKDAAPNAIHIIILVSLKVAYTASLIIRQLNERFTIVLRITPTAPMADASVGVANPKKIDPRTPPIIIKGNIIFLLKTIFSLNVNLREWAGHDSGWTKPFIII